MLKTEWSLKSQTTAAMFQNSIFFFFYKNAFLTLCCFLLEKSLKVQMSTKLMMLFLNTDTSVPCLISEYSTPQLDNNKRITWYLKTQDTDQEKILFTFIAGNHSPPRVGSSMLDSEIKKRQRCTISAKDTAGGNRLIQMPTHCHS